MYIFIPIKYNENSKRIEIELATNNDNSNIKLFGYALTKKMQIDIIQNDFIKLSAIVLI